MSKSFLLNEIQRRTLQQMNDISQINEYGWKNLNILRLKPSKLYEVGDSEISFQLDSSLLASNYALNRIQLEIDYEVIATCVDAGLDGVPRYAWQPSDTVNPNQYNYPYVVPAEVPLTGGADQKSFASYLTSPSNGGLDFLVGNKSFSNVKIKNGSNDLRDDKRSFAKLDILGRMLDEDKLIKEGLYPDFEKGQYNYKAGGDFELTPLAYLPVMVDPDTPTAYIDAGRGIPPMYAKGCSPTDTVEKNLFFKRNTNNQYIVYGDVYFRKLPTDPWANALNAKDATSDILSEIAPIRDIVEFNPYKGEVTRHWYKVIPDVSYFKTPNIQQKTEMKVFEDLLGDVLTTVYNKKPDYRPLPASLLNFTFTISPFINNLYKTSNDFIKSVEVNITKMRLNVFTFNYGLLAIEPTTYYVPYYAEKVDTQNVDPTATQELQTLKYNKMPNYILLYAQESLSSSFENVSQNLRTVPIKEISLEINNDQGTALFNSTIKELQQKSLKNLGYTFSNNSAMWRKNNANICAGLPQLLAELSLSPTPLTPGPISTYYFMTTELIRKFTNTMGTMWSNAFLEGVYLLKIGEDIRIEPSMMPSLNRPVSMNWKIKFGDQFTNNAIANSINVNATAFFPSYYIMNPQTGLIKAQDHVINDEDFWVMLRNTNAELENMKDKSNRVQYTSEHPNMMLGSGWFGSLFKALPMIPAVASTISSIAQKGADITGSKALGKVASVASTVGDVGNLVKKITGKGAKKVKKLIKK